MAGNSNENQRNLELSPIELRAQLGVLEKGLIDSKMSLNSGKSRSSVANQRRQIARILTQLQKVEHIDS